MNERVRPPTSPTLAGPLDDPFKDWPNSDLLIEEEDREFFKRHNLAYAPIFDWPELRSLFVQYDFAAAKALTRSRRFGIFAVATGFVSLCVAAYVAMLKESADHDALGSLHLQAILGTIAATLALVSVIIGYTQILKGEGKTQWLMNRFWSERIRQLHFQLIVNNLSMLIAAIQKQDNLKDWVDFRARELDRFKHEYLRGVEDKIHHLETDEAEAQPWIAEEWDVPPPIPAPSADLDRLLRLLEAQRFGIQVRYAERKLINGWHSPAARDQWVLKLSEALTAVLLLATTMVGFGSIFSYETGSSKFLLGAGFVAALSSSSIVAMRALKEGLLFTADAERYKWYLAAVRTLYHRYEHAETEKRIHLLRDLEHVAYQEMRRFILSGSQARFVM